MIFTPENAAKIMAGLKTQTRRPVRDNERFEPADAFVENGRIVVQPPMVWADRESAGKSDRVRWYVGCTYAVQPGRGKRAIGRIRLLGIRDEWLHDISDSDARAEGFSGRDEFEQVWRALYPRGPYCYDDDPTVWVLTFTLAEGA